MAKPLEIWYDDFDQIIKFSKEDLEKVLEDYIIFDYEKINKKLCK